MAWFLYDWYLRHERVNASEILWEYYAKLVKSKISQFNLSNFNLHAQ